MFCGNKLLPSSGWHCKVS